MRRFGGDVVVSIIRSLEQLPRGRLERARIIEPVTQLAQPREQRQRLDQPVRMEVVDVGEVRDRRGAGIADAEDSARRHPLEHGIEVIAVDTHGPAGRYGLVATEVREHEDAEAGLVAHDCTSRLRLRLDLERYGDL
jgi:hypothetical protein